ncbi:hypothetical protein [Corallococcus sp. 4LFB]
MPYGARVSTAQHRPTLLLVENNEDVREALLDAIAVHSVRA